MILHLFGAEVLRISLYRSQRCVKECECSVEIAEERGRLLGMKMELEKLRKELSAKSLLLGVRIVFAYYNKHDKQWTCQLQPETHKDKSIFTRWHGFASKKGLVDLSEQVQQFWNDSAKASGVVDSTVIHLVCDEE